MEIERIKIKLKDLEQNTGQIAGVPKNPRQWSKEDVDLLAKSIDETPELLQMRPIIAVEQDGKYIIIGGNLRFSAVKKLEHKETDCYVLKDAAVSKIKEIAIKDNGSFGEWDFDELANCWDDLPLNDWGVEKIDFVSPDSFGEDFELPVGEKTAFQTVSFSFTNEQASFVKECLGLVDCDVEYFGNKNKNANKMYQIVKEWAGVKKL